VIGPGTPVGTSRRASASVLPVLFGAQTPVCLRHSAFGGRACGWPAALVRFQRTGRRGRRGPPGRSVLRSLGSPCRRRLPAAAAAQSSAPRLVSRSTAAGPPRRPAVNAPTRVVEVPGWDHHHSCEPAHHRAHRPLFLPGSAWLPGGRRDAAPVRVDGDGRAREPWMGLASVEPVLPEEPATRAGPAQRVDGSWARPAPATPHPATRRTPRHDDTKRRRPSRRRAHRRAAGMSRVAPGSSETSPAPRRRSRRLDRPA
jgi:hypothetical protein